jgi:hypothetical protein
VKKHLTATVPLLNTEFVSSKQEQLGNKIKIKKHKQIQCFGSGSYQVNGSVSGSGSRRAKITTKKEKLRNLGFEVLGVLFWGLKASSVAWMSIVEAYG